MSDMRVSVIIPVFHAADFVAQAVESALAQPETAEVLLVEDGSPDHSLEVCEALTARYGNVRLLRHPNGENRGAGASRNLGMKAATSDIIAFLDADDYYLPNRFAYASEVLASHPECDGVYDAVGMLSESLEGAERWRTAGKQTLKLQTMQPGIAPENLAKSLLIGSEGYFLLDGLLIRKSAIMKTGWMNERLRLHQDTEYILRLAMTCRLLPSCLHAPIAMWRVHPNNRISAPRSALTRYRDKMKYWRSLYSWVRQHGTPEQQQLVRDGVLAFNRTHKLIRNLPGWIPDRLVIAVRQLRLLMWPQLLADQAARNLRQLASTAASARQP